MDTTLQAKDGRSLESPVRIDFQVDVQEPDDHTPSWDPEAQAALAGKALPIGPSQTETSPADVEAPQPTVFGEGHVELEVGGGQKVPARILRCERGAEGMLSGVEVDFETTPGDWVNITMNKLDEKRISAKAILGVQRMLEGRGRTDEGWRLSSAGETIYAQGQIGNFDAEIGFSLTGKCPAP